MGAVLNSTNLIIGTNRSNVDSGKDPTSYFWVGQNGSSDKHTLECVFTLDAPATSLTISFSCKYRLMQTFNDYYFRCYATNAQLSTFPLNNGEMFTKSGNNTSTITVKLYGNFSVGTLYVYFGLKNGVTSQNQVDILASSIVVNGVNTAEKVDLHEINVNNVYRYSSDFNTSYWWKPVSTYTTSRVGCYGMSGSTYNAVCIPVGRFSFTGGAKRLLLRWDGHHTETHTYRWALCTSMTNATSYQHTLNAVSDSTQLKQGTFYDNSTSATVELIFDISGTATLPNTDLYLYIWAYESGGAAPHILTSWNITAVLYYQGGLVHISNGTNFENVYTVHIGNGTNFNDMYIPYIYIDDGSGSPWKIMT